MWLTKLVLCPQVNCREAGNSRVAHRYWMSTKSLAIARSAEEMAEEDTRAGIFPLFYLWEWRVA